MSAELPRQLGQVRLERKLGAGGMGVVYQGVHVATGQQVAVKLLRGEQSLEGEESVRFVREVRFTASLGHPNIIKVLDLGRTPQGELFYVMEYLPGESLSQKLKRLGRLPASEAVALGVQVCSALQAAHDKGIVHRDIKPANVMLVDDGGAAPLAKVVDFGIAKSLNQTTAVTGTGLMVGTLSYMAPEQLLGLELDGRADQYSVGVMLYQLLTGTLPFAGKDSSAVLFHQVNTAPERAVDRAPDAAIPQALSRVVQRCLAKPVEERYPSMAALSEALVASLAADDAIDLTTVPFWRCAKCEVDQSRYAERCPRCGTERDSAEQVTFMRRLIGDRLHAEQQAAQSPATASPGASPALELAALELAATPRSSRPRAPALPMAPMEAPLSQQLARPERRFPPHWVMAFFRSYSLETWGRVMGVAVAVLLALLFIGARGIDVPMAILVLLAVVGAVGVWAHTRD